MHTDKRIVFVEQFLFLFYKATVFFNNVLMIFMDIDFSQKTIHFS